MCIQQKVKYITVVKLSHTWLPQNTQKKNYWYMYIYPAECTLSKDSPFLLRRDQRLWGILQVPVDRPTPGHIYLCFTSASIHSYNTRTSKCITEWFSIHYVVISHHCTTVHGIQVIQYEAEYLLTYTAETRAMLSTNTGFSTCILKVNIHVHVHVCNCTCWRGWIFYM